jgi:CRISPR-associated protein Cas5t
MGQRIMNSLSDTKTVIKIEVVGTVTSFCYPHFKQGMQPTFEMPPPATIYGHICSAVGDYVPPDTLEFGYTFTHAGKFVDYKEHLHFGDPIQPFPFDRELLFNPRLTLYVTPVDLIAAFQRPYYAVCLGRSQDLVTYQSIRLVGLQRAEAGYFEHTLLPAELGPRLGADTIAVTMPRYISPRRVSNPGSYAMLRDTAEWPAPRDATASRYDDDEDEMLVMENDEHLALWVDPESPPHRKYPELRRAVWFHRFV